MWILSSILVSRTPFTNMDRLEMRIWISNYTRYFTRDIITHSCLNFNDGLTKPSLKLGHGWLITSHCFTKIYFIILELIPMLFKLFSGSATESRRTLHRNKYARDSYFVMLCCCLFVGHITIFFRVTSLLHWHWSSLTIAPDAIEHHWMIWVNKSHESI